MTKEMKSEQRLVTGLSYLFRELHQHQAAFDNFDHETDRETVRQCRAEMEMYEEIIRETLRQHQQARQRSGK